MENAVVYARYSSHNQTEQSIEGQLAAAKNMLKLTTTQSLKNTATEQRLELMMTEKLSRKCCMTANLTHR